MEAKMTASLTMLGYMLDLPDGVEITKIEEDASDRVIFYLSGVEQHVVIEDGQWVEAHYQQYPEEGPQFIGFQPLE